MFSPQREVAFAGHPSVGTAFAVTGPRLSARRFWLGHAADATGRLVLDDGGKTITIESATGATITSWVGRADGGVVRRAIVHGTYQH